eukprot:tig00000269_g23702.t1
MEPPAQATAAAGMEPRKGFGGALRSAGAGLIDRVRMRDRNAVRGRTYFDPTVAGDIRFFRARPPFLVRALLDGLLEYLNGLTLGILGPILSPWTAMLRANWFYRNVKFGGRHVRFVG